MDNKKIGKIILQGVSLIMIISIALYFAHLAKESEQIKNIVGNYGYIGIFIISVMSGFNLVVPIPAVSFLPLFLESGLDYWTTIAIMSAGMTLSDSVAYFLGDFGKKIIPSLVNKKLEKKIKLIHEKYNWAPLVLLFLFASVAPFPNEVLLVPFAFLNYRFIHLLPIIFIGNSVFNFLYSKGIINIFNLF